MTKILFFDTETTGLIESDLYHFSEIDKIPRLVQLAYILYDLDQNVLKSANYIVKPYGFTIPSDVSAIHGITTERAKQEGSPIIRILGDFLCTAIQADYFICHNFKFDYRIIGAEAVRAGFEMQYNDIFQYRLSLCTMETTKELCKIQKGNSFKRPNLSELYRFLFNSSFANAHTALADVEATAKCFFELKGKGFYKVVQEQYISFVVLFSFVSSSLLDLDTMFECLF